MKTGIEHHQNINQEINQSEINRYQTIKKIVNAVKWTVENIGLINEFFGADYVQLSQDETIIYLKTSEGDAEVHEGDFLIKDDDGKIYARDADQFADEYEPVGKKLEKPTVKRDKGNSFEMLDFDTVRGKQIKLKGEIKLPCPKDDCDGTIEENLGEQDNLNLIIGRNDLGLGCVTCGTKYLLPVDVKSAKVRIDWRPEDLEVRS